VAVRPFLNRSRGATFLCYHSVAERGPRYLTITADLFERQLAELRRRSLRTGDLAALKGLAEGGKVDNSVFLTFDDGFLDNYETVLPLLRQYDARAFVFVLPPIVDEGGPLNWPEVSLDLAAFPNAMRSVTWEMLGEMKEGGFEVGSHTLSHKHLPDIHGEELRQELWESRSRVKERLGSCDTLAYPFGEWSREVAAAAAECGYSFAFSLPTTAGQRTATPLSIPRINVDYRDGERRFGAKLSPLGKEFFLHPSVALARKATRKLRMRSGKRSS
jgi:peptidoglycan/xylan/chitin deacetylase (PgdA/CDA1 family)